MGRLTLFAIVVGNKSQAQSVFIPPDRDTFKISEFAGLSGPEDFVQTSVQPGTPYLVLPPKCDDQFAFENIQVAVVVEICADDAENIVLGKVSIDYPGFSVQSVDRKPFLQWLFRERIERAIWR